MDRFVVIIVSALFGAGLVAGPAAPAWAQAPLQSQLPTPQSRPQDQARAALAAGDFARALAIADTALVTFPSDAQLRFVRGVALNRLGRLPAAEEAFLALTQEYPDLPEPYNNLAVVRAAQGKLDLARSALEEAIRAVPDYAMAHENLGDVYVQLAARSFRTAQRLGAKSAALDSKLKLVADLAVPAPDAARPASRQP